MLTTSQVKNLEPPATGSKIHYDGRDGVSGFGIRTTAAGAKAFVLNYRVAGTERRLTIGAFPVWSVTQAREEARRLIRRIDQGLDPMAERHAEREAPTVKALADRYVEERLPKLRPGTQRNSRSMLKWWILPELGRTKLAALRPADVERLHTKISKTGAKTHANRTIALLSSMLSAAVRWEYVDKNVARGAIERNPEVKRRRYLSPAEIARLSEALAAAASQDAADVIRLALLTGARRGEVSAMRWDQLDLSAGTWTKKASDTKQRRDHTAPLGAAALEILVKQRAKANARETYVFPGRAGAGFLNVRTTWQNVRKAAGLDDVRLHDLRHSFASILVSGGASLPLIGSLLGHSNPSTTARYSHLFLDPQRAAVERVGAIVSGGGEPAEVVPLDRDRRARR